MTQIEATAERRVTVMVAKRDDPYEYGYMLAGALHPTDHFRQMIRAEADQARAELMAEGWNEFQEDRNRPDRTVALWA